MKLFNFFLISLIFELINIQILTRSNTVIASENIEIKNSYNKNQPIKTITSNGYGTTIESAAQNAAENALTKVVGSFIDSETQIKKQKEIRDGVLSRSKVIEKDIRNYSKGSIMYFEILNVKQIDSIFNVTARVDVRIEDFQTYIRGLGFNTQSFKRPEIEEKDIQTVTSNGYGNTIESAVQKAAENALKQVIGSFIDSETQIKKQKEIRDGVLSRTKIINKDIRNYSQGSIKYFEILSVKKNGSVFNVNARVDVRLDEFRAYFKGLGFDVKAINSGLFTSINTDKKNKENQIDLLGKVLNPLIRGEVVQISIGEPQRLNQLSAFNCKYISKSIWCPSGDFYGRGRKGGQNMSPKGAIVIPITFNLNADFKDNAINILQNISDKKLDSSIQLSKKLKDFGKTHDMKDYQITLFNSYDNSYFRYLLTDAREYNLKKNENGRKIIPVRTYPWYNCKDNFPKIKLSLVNKNKISIWEKSFQQCDGSELNSNDNLVSVSFFYVSPDKNRGYIEPIYSSLYNRLRMEGQEYARNVIFDHSRLLLIIEPKNALNSINAIKLEYVAN